MELRLGEVVLENADDLLGGIEAVIEDLGVVGRRLRNTPRRGLTDADGPADAGGGPCGGQRVHGGELLPLGRCDTGRADHV